VRRTFKVIDLFAGAGGFSQGFMQVEGMGGVPGFEIIRAVEVDRAACETLRLHLAGQDIPVERVVLEGNLESETVKQQVIKDGQGVDVIIGGPPCQTFSLASPARCGKEELRQRLQNDSRDRLYRYYIEIVEGIKPGFVVFENVEGIMSKRITYETTGEEKRAIELVIEGLRSIGYDTSVIVDGKKNDFLILNAADFGVPQIRRRVIVIANRLGIPNPVPKPAFGTRDTRPYRTLASAISHLPVVLPPLNTVKFEKLKKLELVAEYPSEYLYYFVRAIIHLAQKSKGTPVENELSKLASVAQKSYREVECCRGNRITALRKFADTYNDNLNGLNGEIYDQSKFPAPHIARPHNIRDICIFARMKSGVNSARFMRKDSRDYDRFLAMIYPYSTKNHRDTYVRQSWTSPSTTILSHMNRDGLKFIHPDQPRTFTPCEAALIQSFSSSSKFKGTRSEVFWQIGNAVPPLMARAIGEAIYTALIEYYSESYLPEQFILK